MAIENVNYSGLHVPVQFSVVIFMRTKSGIYRKRFVIIYRYTLHVI